ncbi:hypothetical protein H4R33_004906 [Dimargaris cristalligena]|nr:hypothetical protein H4R33_004906 [Dimargaris cristalligena]
MGHLDAGYSGDLAAAFESPDLDGSDAAGSTAQVKKRRMTLPTLEPVSAADGSSTPHTALATPTPGDTPFGLATWPEQGIPHSSAAAYQDPHHIATTTAEEFVHQHHHLHHHHHHHQQQQQQQQQQHNFYAWTQQDPSLFLQSQNPFNLVSQSSADLSSSNHSDATLQDNSYNNGAMNQGFPPHSFPNNPHSHTSNHHQPQQHLSHQHSHNHHNSALGHPGMSVNSAYFIKEEPETVDPATTTSSSNTTPSTMGTFDNSIEGLTFSPGSDVPRPLPPRVSRVLSHRSPMRGNRFSSKKPRSLSLAFDKSLAAAAEGNIDPNATHSPGPITPAMFSPSFVEALNTPTGHESPMFFHFSSPGVEPSQLIHNNVDMGFPLGDGLHSPAHMNTTFAQALDSAAGVTMDPSSLALAHNGGLSMGMPFSALHSPLRSRVNSLTPFPPNPSTPLSPHTPMGDNSMATSLMSMAMMNGMAGYNHPQVSVTAAPPSNPIPTSNAAGGHHLVALNKDFGVAPSALGLGGVYRPDDEEKCIIIMTPKVAQKSYGSEKRFLCPPPTVLLLSSNWYIPPYQISPNTAYRELLNLAGPKISVGIPNETSSQPAQFEWVGNGLKSAPANIDPAADNTITGRCVSKNLFINEADEKRKKVDVHVRLQTPTGENIGMFQSKPIKVISKPSKKRQSLKNIELCIHHGTTVSLFNRLRSQTVSTKYLGASNSIASGGPRPDWSKQPQSASGGSENTFFVARTNNWDPFAIWIANPHQAMVEADNYQSHPPMPGYPPIPAIAVQPRMASDFSGAGESGSGNNGTMVAPSSGTDPNTGLAVTNSSSGGPIPIHYNQHVVLQCLSTGMVSPVMIIRKVEKGSLATGGVYSSDPGREVMGDPVSQLHKVAFEIHTPHVEPGTTYPNGDKGQYLACLSEVVGTQLGSGGKKPSSHLATPPNSTDGEISPTTPKHNMGPPHHLMDAHAAAVAAGNVPPHPHAHHLVGGSYGPGVASAMGMCNFPNGLNPTGAPSSMPPTSSVLPNRKPARGQKRNSMSHHGQSSYPQDHSASASAWVEDATDAAVWTIVGTEFAQYTFKPSSSGEVIMTSGPMPFDMVASAGAGPPGSAHAMSAGVTQQPPPGPPSSGHHHIPHHSAAGMMLDPHGQGGTPSFLQTGFGHPSAMGGFGEMMASSTINTGPITHNVTCGESCMSLAQLRSGNPDADNNGDNDQLDGNGETTNGHASDGEGTPPNVNTVLRPVLTVLGDNYTRDVTVWFGNIPSPWVEFHSPQVLVCVAPIPGDQGFRDELRGTTVPVFIRTAEGSADNSPAFLATGQSYTL